MLSISNIDNNIEGEYSSLYLLLSNRDINILIIKIEDNKDRDNEDNKDNKDNKNNNKEKIIYNKEIKDKEERPYSRDSSIFKKYSNNASEAKGDSLFIEGRVASANLNN